MGKVNAQGFDEIIKTVTNDETPADGFGFSVNLSEGMAIVGAYQDDDKGKNSGSAYIFKYNGNTWVEEKIITSATEGDRFGKYLSVFGDEMVVSATGDNVKVKKCFVYFAFICILI